MDEGCHFSVRFLLCSRLFRVMLLAPAITDEAPWTTPESHASSPAVPADTTPFPAPPRPAPARRDEDATDILRVCRNRLNTVDTRPRGYFWFSA